MSKSRPRPRKKSGSLPPDAPPTDSVIRSAPKSVWIVLSVIFIVAFGSTYYLFAPKSVTIFATRLPSGWIFISEDPAHPVLRKWRSEQDLDTIVSKGKTDLDKFSLVMEWIQHLGGEKKSLRSFQSWNARRILEKLEYENRRPSRIQKAVMFAQSVLSLGYVCRYVQPTDKSLIKQMFGVEVFSPERKKWIYFDPDSGGFYQSSNGVPLSAMEIDKFAHNFYFLRNNTLSFPAYIHSSAHLSPSPEEPIDPVYFEPYRLRFDLKGNKFIPNKLKVPLTDLVSDNINDIDFPFDFKRAQPIHVTSQEDYERLLSSGKALQVYKIDTRFNVLEKIFHKLYQNYPSYIPLSS